MEKAVAMATSHQSHVSDPEYHNWVRCVLGLQYTQEGLHPFIDKEAKLLHETLKSNISSEPDVHSFNCGHCTRETLSSNHAKKDCPLKKKRYCICASKPAGRRPCPAAVCGRLYDEIIHAHRHRDPAWGISDMRLWTSNYWEVAKNFLTSTGSNEKVSSAADTDCSGLLNIAINMLNISYRHGISSAPGVFKKCREARHSLLHSSSQKLSDKDRDKFVQIMVDVLECTDALKNDPVVKQAVANLQKVKSDLYIVTAADKKAASDKLYEEEKIEFKCRLIELVKKNFVFTSIADNMSHMVSVETFFVDPTFKILEVNTFSVNKAIPRKVNSIKDIFFKEDHMHNRIYLTGDAGMGKTTFCKQILHAWWNIHSGRSHLESDFVCEEYMNIMKNFDFIFYLPLRSFHHLQKVEEMLQSYYCPNKADFLSILLSRESCLVILDGLDEWAPPESYGHPVSGTYGLPDFGDLYRYTALVTTRPWKLEVLRLKSTEIDLQVQLDGFDKSQQDQLSRRMIDYLNEETNRKKKLTDFRPQGVASGLINIPILLKQLIVLWHSRNSIGDSMCKIYCEMIDFILEQSQSRNRGTPLSGPHDGMEGIKSIKLPKCFELTDYCPGHGGILYALAKVAFKTLFDDDQSCSLVFRHNSNIHGFSTSDMKLLLKTGMLSQHIDTSCDAKKYKSLSFLHKSIQEFLATLYICISDSDACLDQVFQLCKTQEMILQMKAVFIFASGLNADIAEKIPKRIQVLLDNEESKEFQIDTSDLSFQLQKFIIECLQESCELNIIPVWKIESIVLSNNPVDMKFMGHLIRNNDIRCVTITIDNPIELVDTDMLDILQNCLTDLSSCSLLHSVILSLGENIKPEFITRVYEALLHGRAMKRLHFTYDIPRHWEPVFQYLQKGNLMELKSLSISHFLHLHLSHSDIQVLLEKISIADSLQTLSLSGIFCKEDGEKCSCVLDLTKHVNLRELEIYDVHIGKVIIGSSKYDSCSIGRLPKGTQVSLLDILQKCHSLKTLKLSDFHNEETSYQIVSLLQGLPNLTHLLMSGISFSDKFISMSQASQIETIELRNLDMDADDSLVYFVKELPVTNRKIHITMEGNVIRFTKLYDYVRGTPERFVVTSEPKHHVFMFHTMPFQKIG